MLDVRNPARRRVRIGGVAIGGLSALVGILGATRLQGQAAPHVPSPQMIKEPAARGPVLRVLAATDGQPVVGARVLRESTPLGRTDLRGVAVLPALREGARLRVQALGFREESVVVGTAGASYVVRLEATPAMLPSLVTTAGQRVVRASELARAVTVLQRADIEAAAAVSANQLLRQLPGVQELSAPPARTSLSIRGFSDARVLVLVDGEPVPGSLMDSRDIGRLSTLAAERIEVTKGPSAVEYGSEAIGGVINLVQAAPSSSLTLDGTLRGGELGRREGHLGVSNTLGRVGVRLNGGWRQVDQVTAINADNATFSRTWDSRADVRWRATDRFTMRLDVQSTMERQRWPVDGLYNGFIDNVATQGFLEGTYRGLGGQLRIRGFAQQFAYQYRQAVGLAPIAGSGDSLEQREHMQRLLVAYSAQRGRHTLDAGVQLSARELEAPARIENDRVRDVVREVYLRDAVTLGVTHWTAGVRHTDGSLWGAATNPTLGVSVPLATSFVLRANMARGFRAPGFKDIRYTFTNATAGYTIEGNPSLTPESSWNSTIGARWAPRAGFALDVEAYRTDLRDMIDTRFLGISTAGLQRYANVNISRARSEGLEVNVTGRLGGVEWNVGYDHLRARDLEYEVPLSRRSPHTLRARGTQRWNVAGGLTADLTVRYTGAAPLVTPASADGTTPPVVGGEQGAMTTVDLQLRQQWRAGLELSVGGNNLLGQLPANWTPAFGRQLFAGVRWHWQDRAR